MTGALRTLIGMALGVAGVALPAWGLFHLVRQPSCGSDGITTVGPPCPDEIVWWILAIVGSAVVLVPLAIGIAGRGPSGRMRLFGPILLAEPIALVAAVVVSLVGASSDPDTHWVGWVVLGVAGVILLFSLPGIVRMAMRPPAYSSLRAPLAVAAGDPEAAAQIAQLAGQLQQVADAKEAAARDRLAERLRRLDELRAAGTISAEEHRRRRAEILDEV
ncbi:MAG TPA: SHOCT domain-containing protein [Capillimicrobium sp.]|nr:SHOCT domain-containing protein [Capillimicrobium sp.]